MEAYIKKIPIDLQLVGMKLKKPGSYDEPTITGVTEKAISLIEENDECICEYKITPQELVRDYRPLYAQLSQFTL